MVEIAVNAAIIALLIGISAFFGGIEVAFLSVTNAQVEQFISEKRKGAQALKRLRENPNRMITTVMLGNNLVNVAAATLAAAAAIEIFGSLGVGVATGVMTVLILVFGEITPKSYCNIHSARLSLLFARTIELLGYGLYPAVILFEGITRGILKLLKSDTRRIPLTSKEFEAVLEIGVREKVLEKSEKRFIEGVLKFNDLSVHSIMTPRLRMYTLNASMNLTEAMPFLVSGGYSRVPLIEGSKDKVVGIVHLRDVVRTFSEGRVHLPLKDIARKPTFVSQEKLLSELLKEFQGRGEHMSVVVDEFGGVEGIVTMEDIIEEVFGEIMDEKDVSPKMMVRLNKNTAIVHGETDIHIVNDFLNVEITSDDDYSTISGLLHARLQDIPRQGDCVNLDDCTLIVEKVENNMPVRVRVARKYAQESASRET